jgi:hypothetical protein
VIDDFDPPGTVDAELPQSCRTLAGESRQRFQLDGGVLASRTLSVARCASDRSKGTATKATAWRPGSSGSMRFGGRRIGGYPGGSVCGNGIRPMAGLSDPDPGPAGLPIDFEASPVPGHQGTASEASGPGLPDRTAPQEAPVNSASRVLIHDQEHEPDPRKEPYVSPPPRAPHHDQPPKWRCHASRIQPPSAPHARATKLPMYTCRPMRWL